MKAMVVREPGGVEAMKIESIHDPVAGARDVIVKVDACGVCFHDLLTRAGTLNTSAETHDGIDMAA